MLDLDERNRVIGVKRTDGRDALEMIRDERQRQAANGYSEEHDDSLTTGLLAQLGACYAAGSVHLTQALDATGSSYWPSDWNCGLLEGPTRLRQLVIAGAFIVAEIERLQRARPAELVADHKIGLDEIQI